MSISKMKKIVHKIITPPLFLAAILALPGWFLFEKISDWVNTWEE